jgi:transcriptional regulator
MYVPESFNELDRDVLLDLVEAHGFATLLSWTGGDPVVSHIPLLVDRAVPGQEQLLGHVARANRHWELFDGKAPALAIFSGPHGYISPSWYARRPAVPTWNYAVVHVHGRPRIVDTDATWDIVKRMVERYEGPRRERWSGELPPDYVAEQLAAIVGFEIPIDRLEGKFKLGQNREPADRANALAGLEREPDRANQELAAFARRYFARRGEP